MTDRAPSRAAWVVMAVVILSFAGAGYLEWINAPLPTADWGDDSGGAYLFPLLILPFPMVGCLIAARHPGNAIGWIMLGVGAVTGLSGVVDGYVRYGLVTEPGSLPHADVGLAVTAGAWVWIIVPIMTFPILLFPDGKLPSPRWRPVAYLSAFAMVVPYLVITVAPGTFAELGYPRVSNPLGIEALRPVKDLLLSVLLLIPIAVIGCAAALVQRFRRSRGQERLQLKWLASAATFVAATYAVTMAATLTTDLWSADETPRWVLWLQQSTIFTFVLIPAAIGIAILRHRLYNIDRLINRTLVYAGLTGVLTLSYLFLVTVLQSILKPIAGDSELAVAGSTLAVAGLFRPVRGRVQGFIDRRFYRRKYDAAQTLERFSERLKDEIDLSSLSSAMRGVVARTMQPAHVSLWLRDGQNPPLPSVGEATAREV